MKSIPFSNIRETFTSVADEVQFYKEPYMLTKNNKAVIGIVPAEILLMLGEVLALAQTSEELAKITDKYTLAISKEDYDMIAANLKDLPVASKKMQASIQAADRKFES